MTVNDQSAHWQDASLKGIAWVAGGRDVRFHFSSAEGEDRSLLCSWASGLTVNLASEVGAGGEPLTWDITFDQARDGTWSVLMDFGGRGEIRLRCNDIETLAS